MMQNKLLLETLRLIDSLVSMHTVVLSKQNDSLQFLSQRPGLYSMVTSIYHFYNRRPVCDKNITKSNYSIERQLLYLCQKLI